ncbi:TetR/AcrR family transcriptional regulator [Paenibacillus monticola]|nr:TetR/AcrR family transcriptional regulator [Paenibacillus monticola]
MDTPNKKNYHHGDLRKTLIHVGIELISESGASSLDLRKVARIAGVSHAAPYRHFADKKALIAAISEEGFNLLAIEMEQAISMKANSAHEQLRGMGHAYVQFAITNPSLVREMFSGLTIEREAYPSLYDISKKLFNMIETVVIIGQEKGNIKKSDSNELTCAIWSMMHGTAILIIENQLKPVTMQINGIEHITQVCMDSLILGLGAS